MSFSIKDTLKRVLSFRSQSTENRPASASAPSTSTTTPVAVIKGTLKRGLSSGSQSTQNRPARARAPAPSTSTTTPVAVVEVQQEAKIEIHVKNEGEIEETHIYKVPLKYLSYTTFRELMERSGEDLNNISGGGQQIHISCKFELFERILKLVKRKELEAKYEESSYDDRLWKRK